MENAKKIKKGEVLIKEGDAIENIFLIKSGRATIFVERSGKKIELGQINQGQVVGEKALFGAAKMAFSVMAATELSYLEVPTKLLAPSFEALSGVVKGVTKATVDALSDTRKALQSIKIEASSVPCDHKLVPKLFAIIYMTSNMTGLKKEDHVQVAWNTLKLYSNRIFLEPHSRVMSVIEILTKLKYAEMVYKKNEEGLEEFTDVKIFNIKIVEEFSDFYQYQFYKPGRSEVMYVDKLAMKIVGGLLQLSEGAEVDHKGAVNLEYESLVADMKSKCQVDLKSNHFDLLEKKGLFATRKNKNDKVYLSFDREEFRKTHTYWLLINEIDKWNERGYIEMKEKEEEKKQSGSGLSCPECTGVITSENKFCPHCGHKLKIAA